MNRAAAAGVLMVVAVSGCSGSEDPKKSSPSKSDSDSSAAECSGATAEATARAQIMQSKIEPACVKVSKGDSFTLLNADTKTHNLTTTQSSPVQLRVDLKEGAAFPYRFKKTGIYTLEDTAAHLALTIIVS